MPTPEQKKKYALDYYYRNKAAILEKQKEKRSEGPGREKYLEQQRNWNRDHGEERAEHYFRANEIQKRLTRRVTRMIREDGLTITRNIDSDLRWRGPGMRREIEIEQQADAILQAAERGRRDKGREQGECQTTKTGN
jgi:hypothetical protein